MQETLLKLRRTVGTGARACALSDYTPQVAVLRGMAFPANIASEPLPALYNAREGAFCLSIMLPSCRTMTKHLISFAAALALTTPVSAQEDPQGEPSPNEIVAGAGAEEWVKIPADDLIVMTLAPDSDGNPRKVIIQLMPAPFGENWTANIRTFARTGWYDDITVNRVQDNYVVQWGDANYDNPEANGEPKSLPDGLIPTNEELYSVRPASEFDWTSVEGWTPGGISVSEDFAPDQKWPDSYEPYVGFRAGWPLAGSFIGSNMPVLDSITGEAVANNSYEFQSWPVHCYGMVGVGRNYSPDAGTGAELYTVIGHAPRHLDRNIALVGRVVEGIEHLSSLPRGKGALGFYEDESKRTPILTVRVASDLPESERPAFEYLDTAGETFARYADARANRRDPFFIVPAGGADICNIPVPVRRVAE